MNGKKKFKKNVILMNNFYRIGCWLTLCGCGTGRAIAVARADARDGGEFAGVLARAAVRLGHVHSEAVAAA